MPFLNRNTSTKQYFNTSFTDKQLDTIDQIISEYIQNELVPFNFNDVILIFDSRASPRTGHTPLYGTSFGPHQSA